MSQFPVQTLESAPEASKSTLEATKKAYGFLPNLFGTMATSPALVEAYAALSKIFGSTSFSPTEQQIVLLATSELNGCTYCMAAHSVVAKMSKVPDDVIEALRSNQPLGDAKLEALRRLTVAVVESRGWPSEEVVQAFYDAGYTPAQYLEVVLGIGLKTLSNYTNHIAQTPLDDAFKPAAWSKAD
ncbi:MAG: carboxymuconolactone decarboxylase family protein [Planctomycetota bacterium]